MTNYITVVVFGVALAGCFGTAGTPADPPLDQLRSATYDGVLQEPVTLVDGRYEGDSYVAGAASRPVVTLVSDPIATGDITGDGIGEAVVALAHDAGGSGVFMYLAVVNDPAGNPDNIATVSLGDRVRLAAIDIREGRIIADLVEHAPKDPMCCPTREVRREWVLQDGALIELQPAVEAQDSRFRGHLAWGDEKRSFTECGGARTGWVINGAGDELVAVYEELTMAPDQPMFVEVRGEWTAAPRDGFGAGYEQALRITELLRAENEGFGCRLELDDVLFIVSGNEPSWRLRIREDGIFMRSMNSPDERVFAAPETRVQPGGMTFESGSPDAGIRVALEERRCIDTMSGARFSWAAIVDVDGRRLAGCAAEGL